MKTTTLFFVLCLISQIFCTSFTVDSYSRVFNEGECSTTFSYDVTVTGPPAISHIDFCLGTNVQDVHVVGYEGDCQVEVGLVEDPSVSVSFYGLKFDCPDVSDTWSGSFEFTLDGDVEEGQSQILVKAGQLEVIESVTGPNGCGGETNMETCEDPCFDVVCPQCTSCDSNGQCTINETGGSCDDGFLCTENDVCNAGVCEGTPVVCEQCHECDADSGECAATSGDSCDDGFLCTVSDVCNAGVCEGTPVVCEQCHECDASNGECAATSGDPCDDGLLCTEGDVCNAGVCEGTPIVCEQCHECDPSNGVCEPTSGDPCDDSLFCTVNDVCTVGVCGGEERNCSDNDYCTIDTCNEEQDQCDHEPVVCDAYEDSIYTGAGAGNDAIGDIFRSEDVADVTIWNDLDYLYIQVVTSTNDCDTNAKSCATGYVFNELHLQVDSHEDCVDGCPALDEGANGKFDHQLKGSVNGYGDVLFKISLAEYNLKQECNDSEGTFEQGLYITLHTDGSDGETGFAHGEDRLKTKKWDWYIDFSTCCCFDLSPEDVGIIYLESSGSNKKGGRNLRSVENDEDFVIDFVEYILENQIPEESINVLDVSEKDGTYFYTVAIHDSEEFTSETIINALLLSTQDELDQFNILRLEAENNILNIDQNDYLGSSSSSSSASYLTFSFALFSLIFLLF